MNRLLASFTLCVLTLPMARAQDGPAAFEAATIKESASQSNRTVAPDRFSRTYITLSQLLVYAYEMSEFQIVGGPDWVREQRFDVQAKADGAPSADQMRLMVRRLLAERFNLKLHMETKDLPRYALVTARGDQRLGPRLRPSQFDCPAIVAARGPGYRPPTGPPQPGDPPSCIPRVRLLGRGETVIMEGQPMSAIAKLLQPRAGRVVIDKTGLTGTYYIELETAPMSVSGGLSLFTALSEQLGLKLESERGPVEVLVCDSVERPTPN